GTRNPSCPPPRATGTAQSPRLAGGNVFPRLAGGSVGALSTAEGRRVHPALWTLMGFQTRGWLRSLSRSLRTVKGALLALVGLTLLVTVPTTLIMTAVLGIHARWAVAAYVGLLLLFVFMHLFSMALTLVATSAGERLYSRGRRLALAAAALLVLAVAFQVA